MVLVDTVILSYALRRKNTSLSDKERALKTALMKLMESRRAQVIGPVRQELLSGIKEPRQFDLVRDAMRTFANVHLLNREFEEAARISNICRAKGIAGAPTDFLLCSVALLRDWQIFTENLDFHLYAQHLPLQLFEAG